jgi:hypothetical protein
MGEMKLEFLPGYVVLLKYILAFGAAAAIWEWIGDKLI